MLGPIVGRFNVFEKVAKLHAKNSFSFAIVVGDLFKDTEETSDEDEGALNDLLSGRIPIPISIYFSVGEYELPQSVIEKLQSNDNEICENLIFLDKRSTTKSFDGVRIVTLGGRLDPKITAGLSKHKYLPYHTEGDAKALGGSHNTDLLLTNAWPSNAQGNSQVDLSDHADKILAEQCIAELCSTLKPRYHFSTAKIFFEREPFFHLSSDGQPDTEIITRFISLAPFGNTDGQKWLYAFSMDLNRTSLSSLPAGTTASPFISLNKKRAALSTQEQSYSRFSGHSTGPNREYRASKRKRHKSPPPGPEDCFFCLSNPNIATHLVTSIGEDSYVTTAKGPLTTDTTYPTLDFPAHMLIIPLSHSSTFSSISPQESRDSTYNEMTRYRRALQDMLAVKADGKLGAITWELSRADGIHIHWQFLPVTVDLIRKGLVEAAFQVQAENDKYPKFEPGKASDGEDGRTDYFRMWTWDPEQRAEGKKESQEKERRMPLPADVRFDLRFGRKVMAKLLDLETRIQWRDCSQDEGDERKDAENFKKAFKQFDFTLDDSQP